MNYEELCISPDSSIKEALRLLDITAKQILFVLDSQNHLLGTITDGDIRRGILKDVILSAPIKSVMNIYPKTIQSNIDKSSILKCMKANKLRYLPVVDASGKLIDVIAQDDLSFCVQRDNIVVLMVGGLGTRLRPLTDDCPKPLLKIGNKPILENILESFIDSGFHRFYLAVNYKAQMIEEYFGDGSKLGIEIKYIHEKKRMGTAGALYFLPEKPVEPVIVMNGDLLTKLDFGELVDAHKHSNAAATMAVREYSYQVPYGVINCEEDRILSIEEKPEQTYFVNAGIYVLNPEVVAKVNKEEFFDMPELFTEIIGEGQKAGIYPVREYWLDIGRLDDFKRAQMEFGKLV